MENGNNNGSVAAAAAGLTSPVPPPADYKDFPADFTTLTPLYAPPDTYIMPYLTPYPPSPAVATAPYVPPLETAGIITLTTAAAAAAAGTEEQTFPSFVVPVDALTVEMVKNQM